MADPMTWVAIGTAVAGVASAGAQIATKPKTPKMPETKTAPVQDDQQLEAAKRRRIAIAQQQSGSRSAMLSAPGARETLG